MRPLFVSQPLREYSLQTLRVEYSLTSCSTGGAITVDPAVILQAYAVTGYKRETHSVFNI